jgi:hypothetical protein
MLTGETLRMRLALPLAVPVLAALSACANTEVRTPIPERDELGGVRPLVAEPVGAWQYRVETERLDGPMPSPSQSLAGGLRVAVTASPGLSGSAASHALFEGVPSALPVGRMRWPAPPHVSGAVATGGWSGAEVEIAWLVKVTPRGSCAVEVEAVPRLCRPDGCPPVVLADLMICRVLGLDEAVVIGVDPSSPAARQAEALVGSPGRAGRFVIRVRT